MIGIVREGDGFDVTCNGRRVLSHRVNDPFVAYGSGVGKCRQGGGVYRIADSQRRLRSPKACEARLRGAGDAVVDLGGGAEIRLAVEDGNLAIRFSGFPAGTNRIRLRLAASPGDAVFGCGEQYSRLDLRGSVVPVWIGEQGVGRGSDLLSVLANLTHHGAGGSWYTTYWSQASFVASSGWFAHFETDAHCLLDFRGRDSFWVECWEIPGAVRVGIRESLADAVRGLNGLLGVQPALPDWVYDGAILGVQGGRDAVREKFAAARDAGVPVAALWAQDWEGRRVTYFGKQLWWNWKYDQNLYPALPDDVAAYRREGVRFLGYVNPYLAPERELYAEAAARGFLLADGKGKPCLADGTTMPAGVVDLTNPEAFEWMKGVIRDNMIGIGMSGWMADFAELMPLDSVPASGESPWLVHDRYAMLWARCNREAIEEAGLSGEILAFHRSGCAGSSRYAGAAWAGDQTVDFSTTDGLATAVLASISIGFCGIGNTHSDIGGYTSVAWVKRTKETFLRWAEHAAFTPIMRTHESNRPEENWQFYSDHDTLSSFARLVRAHVALKPYLKALAAEYASSGMPQIRHPLLSWPRDPVVRRLKYQYSLGPDLLVAPVVSARRSAWDAYVPEAGWRWFWNSKQADIGWNSVDAPIGRPPVLYRERSEWADVFRNAALAAEGGER